MDYITRKSRKRMEKEYYADEYRVFKIEDGEVFWVIELTAQEALRNVAVNGADCSSVEEYLEEHGPVKISVERFNEKIEVTRFGLDPEIKPACEWAVDHRGILCSTAWD